MMFSFARRLRRQRDAENSISAARPPSNQAPGVRSKPAPAPKRKRRSPLAPTNSLPPAIPSIRPDHHATALSKARSRLALALEHGHAPRTSNNYNYAIKRYLKFASSIGFPEQQALPASEELILLFVCEGLGRTGPGTAKNNLSALRSWHVKNRFPWKRPDCMGLINKALTEFWPHDVKKPKQRPPIKSSMISMLVKAWKDGSPRHVCALAIAVSAWSGQCRLGELLPSSPLSLDPKRIPRRSSWSGSKANKRASEIQLPWTKTTRFNGATVFLVDQRDPLNATIALSNHFKASPLRSDAFLCEYKHGRHSKVLGKEEFLEMCNSVWTAAGIPRITGHSFRIGGTTALLCSGVHPEIVKKMGRWTSDAFLQYWRSLGHLFAQHASNVSWDD
jgi:hypothetical protein